MKFKFIQTCLFLMTLTITSYGQQSQEIKGELDNALKEMTKALEELDIEQLLNQEVFAKIEELKPSKEQIGKIEDMMKISIESLNNIDLSGLEDVIGELETSIEKIDFDKILKSIEKVNPTREAKKI